MTTQHKLRGCGGLRLALPFLGLFACSPDGDAGPVQEGGLDGGPVPTGDAGTGSGGQGDAGVIGVPDAGGGTPVDAAVDSGVVSPGQMDAGLACDPTTAPQVGPLQLVSVVDGLSGLTYAAQAPGSDDWYLVEQAGRIRVFDGTSLRGTPFLDITSDIGSLSSGPFDDERGLLGLAFAPDYAQSGLFYVMMTPTSGSDSNSDMVVRYRRHDSDVYVADPGSREVMVNLGSSSFNHNGGHLVFGPDGMLYVGTGDGGGSNSSNKGNAPQETSSLYGKILRLDPSAAGADYAAAGNPFADDARVLHVGLRNPYRFAFDRLTGDLFIGDVGQDDYEEVDFVAAGALGLNFGWPVYEATHELGRGFALMPGSEHVEPIVEIDRRSSATGPFSDYKSVISGTVYRGSSVGSLAGAYLFGDYVGDRMGALYQCADGTSEVTPINRNCDPNAPNEACLEHGAGVPRIAALTAIMEDHDGELYLAINRDQLVKIEGE